MVSSLIRGDLKVCSDFFFYLKEVDKCEVCVFYCLFCGGEYL